MANRVTQADVAKSAGVHVTTVSLALRNHPSIPPSTRERVQTIAEAMGYRPDPMMQALARYRTLQRHQARRTTALAYVTNWTTRWGWRQAAAHAEFYAGAEARATALGYRIEHFWRGEPGITDRRLNSVLSARGITGLVFASHRSSIDDELDFDWSQFCAVKIDCFPHRPILHKVTNDQRAIMQLVMQQVRAAGYRRVGLVLPRWWDRYVDGAWSAGFLAEQQFLPVSSRLPILLHSGSVIGDEPLEQFDPLVPRNELKSWLARHQPEVIVGHGPFVRPRLTELGLVIPDDVAFADFSRDANDGETAGVRQNCRRVGEVAIEFLAAELQLNRLGLPEYPTATLVDGTWFEGASLPAARSHAVVG